jgi:hypothetical protein
MIGASPIFVKPTPFYASEFKQKTTFNPILNDVIRNALLFLFLVKY